MNKKQIKKLIEIYDTVGGIVVKIESLGIAGYTYFDEEWNFTFEGSGGKFIGIYEGRFSGKTEKEVVQKAVKYLRLKLKTLASFLKVPNRIKYKYKNEITN